MSIVWSTGWNTNVTQQIRSPAESILMWLLERSLFDADPDEFGEPFACFETCISQQELFSGQLFCLKSLNSTLRWHGRLV